MPDKRKVPDYSGEILIVEDNIDSMHLLTDVLENAGYSVRQAQDGYMALATLRNRLPDLVLLDIAMPEIDGYGVCQHMKADPMTKDIPVIFCSAMHDTEYKVEGFELGAVDFITKPYQPEEVLLRVRAHLELSRLRTKLEQLVSDRTEALEKTMHSLRKEMEVRSHIENELKLSSKAFESSFSGIMVTDQHGVIVTVNPAFTRIMGYSKHEAVGNTPDFLKSDKHNDAFYENIWSSLKHYGSWNGEVWSRRKDTNVIPMLETIHEFRDAVGEVTNYIWTLADLSEIKDAQTLIDFLAYRDNLTGLANRVVARKHFEQASIDADREGKKLALLYLDLDRFKVINDSLGHNVGDQLLKLMSARFSGCFSDEYLLSREGGDEFMILTPCIDNVSVATELAEKIIQNISNEIDVDQHKLSLTTSIGVALYPDHGKTFDDLLKGAENALYSVKKRGGNDYCLFAREMDDEARLRMELENGLRNAIANNELTVLYQPKCSFQTGNIIGAEALVRWNSPVLGFVTPDNFIPLAEETGLILLIDEWVITNVCDQIRQWQGSGMVDLKISVNLSTLQFGRGDLNGLIRRVLDSSGISPRVLDLEITESALMANIHSAIETLEGLKEIGVSISLDDFGTGYSSLNYLKRLPIDTLKIDKSFVDEIHVGTSDALIALAVISLGQNLGLNVVAEGVENEEQYDFLRSHGCDEMQGYYFSKPLMAGDFESLVRDSLARHGHVTND